MDQKTIAIRPFAAKAGLAQRTILKARTDAGISECRLSTLKRIAVALGVGVTELFEEEKTS